MATVDPDSPTPLYHQIAEAIRERIRAGDLAPGESLEPLREAAETWGVNLHTVRHAYASLARDGLLEMRRGPGGTRVRPDASIGDAGRGPASPPGGLLRFVEETVERGREEFGLGPGDLAAAIRGRAEEPGTADSARVWVVECSRWQCEAHARQIVERWSVDARPWVLGEAEAPPPGPAIATYFHFNELRRRWPRRFGSLRFVDIRADPDLAPLLAEAGTSPMVCERDEPTARAVVADLLSLVPDADLQIGTVVAPDAAVVIRDAGPSTRVLCPPRVWADLDRASRADRRAVEVRYLLDARRLDEVGRELGWVRRQGGSSERPRGIG